MADPAPKRRWFRFSLRTLVVVVPLVLAAGYWAYRDYAARSARVDFDRTFEALESQTVTDEQLFAASDQCLQAALAVPFADKRAVYTEHLDDLARMCEKWLLYIQTGNPQWPYVEALNETDRRYANGYEQLELVAGKEYAERLKAAHEQKLRLDDYPGALRLTKIHKQSVSDTIFGSSSRTPE